MTEADPAITRRLASMLYEVLLLLGVLSVTFILPHIVLGIYVGINAGPVVTQIHFFLVLLIYFCWFWLHGGQTLAMKTWKLRLVGADGTPIRPAQALLRYLAAWPSVTLLGVGLFWGLFDPERRFLHDRIAGTRIIRD